MFFPLLTWLAWLEGLGGLGLVVLGLADNSPVPLPGSMDVLTIILSAHEKNWWPYYAAMAVIGSVLGGYLSYMLGREGGKETLERKLSKKRAEQVYSGFEKHGFWTLFLPALVPPPFPYSPFTLAAGALDYPPRKFLFAVGAGRTIRYLALAYLGSIYSKQIFGFFDRYYWLLLWILIGVTTAGAIGLIVWIVRRKREGKPAVPKPPKSKKDQYKAA